MRARTTGASTRSVWTTTKAVARRDGCPPRRLLLVVGLATALALAAASHGGVSQPKQFRPEKLWSEYPLEPFRADERRRGPGIRELGSSPVIDSEGPNASGRPVSAGGRIGGDVQVREPAFSRPLLLAGLGFGVVALALGLVARRARARPRLQRFAGAMPNVRRPRARSDPRKDLERLLALVVEVADERLKPSDPGVERLLGRIVHAAEERSALSDGNGTSRAHTANVGPASTDDLAPHYVSADTAPLGFAVARPAWVAPFVLVLFAGVCALLVAVTPALTTWYADAVAVLAGMPDENLLRRGGSVSFRPFFAGLILLLVAFAVGSRAQRLRFLVFSLLLYAGSVLVIDVILALASGRLRLPAPFSPVGGIATGVAGLLTIVISIFACYRLPATVRVLRRLPAPSGLVQMLAACLVGALSLTLLFAWAQREYFPGLQLRFVGGLDSELVIFLLGVLFLLYLAAALERDVKPRSGPPLSVAFLVPAFNESHEIAKTIAAIDEAAANYDGRCRLYVVDNGSRDGTSGAAEEAIERSRALEGVVLHCWTPGKSHALNLGLSFITEDVVVRIDGDTLVSPSLLENLIPWFWDPSVGGVSGLPLPKRSSTPRWLYPLRLIEVYYGVAFLRVAQAAADGVMVMPGLIASYRRRVVQELGGFAERINGEDADITMRIGRLGYRIVTDPTIEVFTEVPADLSHLREQRQRWARGLFHMAGRNISTIAMRQGARGLWILPWSIFNAARRSLMIPVVVCALTVELLDPSVLTLREVSVVAGFIVGLQLIVITAVLLAHRKFRVLPFVPGYLLFRMFRAYIAFETLLTLRLKPDRGETRPRSSARGPAPVDVICLRERRSARKLAGSVR